jgi:DNA primase
MTIQKDELEKLRGVGIHTLLGKPSVGRRLSIRCPHGNRDSTPSCVIYPDNSFYCFSCGKHGKNALDFLVSLEGVDFQKAVEELKNYV